MQGVTRRIRGRVRLDFAARLPERGSMLTWAEFAHARPELAEAGRRLLYQFGVGLGFLGENCETHSCWSA
jgi:hypothetical protein